MPGIESVLLVCAFLCFMTGIFSPGVIVRWGLPSLKGLMLFRGLTVLLIIMTTIAASLPDKNQSIESINEESSIYVFQSIDDETVKVYEVEESGYDHHLKIEIVEESLSSGNEQYIAPDGYEFLQLQLSITNELDDTYPLQLSELQLRTSTFEVLSPYLESQSETVIAMNPQEKVNLSLVYLQPKDESYLTLTYVPHSIDVNQTTEEIISNKSEGNIGDILKSNHSMLQVHEVNRFPHSEKADYEYLEVSLSIKNSTTQTITYYPFNFDIGSVQHSFKAKSLIGISDVQTLEIVELVSGGMTTGTLMFEIPKGAQDLVLYYHQPDLFSQQTLKVNLMETAQLAIPLQSELILNQAWQEVNQLEEMNLNILQTSFTKETQYSQANAHQQFIVIRVELTNASSQVKNYTAFDFKLMNQNGQLLLPSLLMIDNRTELTSGTLAPNEKVIGYLLFEDSDLYDSFKLLYSPSNWQESDCIIQVIS